MLAATDYDYWRWHDPSFRRRAIAFLLALALELGIALLLFLWSQGRPAPPPPKPKEFQLIVPSETPSAEKPAAKGEKSPEHHTAKATAVKITTVKPPVTPPVPPVIVPPKTITLSQDDFAATDISKLPTHGSDSGDQAGGGNNGGAAYGPGEGPGGQKLYNAEWYREPTHAELAGYMPAGVDADWADIACRTIESYHVDSCRSLGESPAGSGVARALRLASWQFLVRPPRVGGKAMVGAWVRIHFYFTKDGK